MRALLARLRDFLRRREIASGFEEEREFHIAELERLYRERGASPQEARDEAVREFGNVVAAREGLRAQAGFPSWDELGSDLRHAARGLLRRPWFAGSVVVILGLGLGAAATIHGMVEAVFLRPLAVSHPEELYALANADPKAPVRVSRGTARRLEAALPPHSVMAYASGEDCAVQVGSLPAVMANVRLVNGSFFEAAGIRPMAGRLLDESDDRIGASTDVVVASYAWAKKNFGAADSAIGRVVTVNRVPMSIVGVLPEAFREIAVGQRTDFWLATASQRRLGIGASASMSIGDDRPNDHDWNREERISWIDMLVRVRPGEAVPLAALRRAWETQRDDLALAEDDSDARERVMRRAWTLESAPQGRSRFRDHFHSTGWLLGGVVAVMLVLVCTNVSGFLLVRSMSRHREIGVRLALGAGPLRVVRLGFLEAAMLSAAGGVSGWLLASWILPSAGRLLAPGKDLDLRLRLGSVAVMAALALVSAVLSALAPALWISRVQPLNALSGNRGLGRAPVRIGRILVVAQFAIAVALVAVAAALGDELQRSLAADPGFEREQVETAVFDASNAGYKTGEIAALTKRLSDAALGLPRVNSVGFCANGILSGSESDSGIYVRDSRALRRQWSSQHDTVSSGYFGVVGIAVLRGREFTDLDRQGSQPVAVVSQSFAHEAFGDADPIGQTFGYDLKPSSKDFTVVGVVADVRLNGVREAPPHMYYVPLAQNPDDEPHFLAIRFTGPVAPLQEAVKAAIARSEPALVLSGWMTLKGRMADDLSGDLATTRLASIFGGCAVFLAGIGIAGSLGYLVVLRQRELALRLAIGASPRQMLRSVLADSLRLGALGCAVGVLAVWLLPEVPAIGAVLYSRPGVDSALAASAIALATALLAGYVPARRAARIDPNQMLRSE
jgi:putative ABC transport system permease protein